MFHFIPRALSVGSLVNSRSFTDLALSDSGIGSISSLLLLYHFVRWNLPFSSSCRNWLTKPIASFVLLRDFIKSSTYILRFTASSSSVFLKQKLVTLKGLAPKRCLVIRILLHFTGDLDSVTIETVTRHGLRVRPEPDGTLLPHQQPLLLILL